VTTPTGSINFSNVESELSISVGSGLNLDDSRVRNLAGVPSGSISMSQLRGKSAGASIIAGSGAAMGAPNTHGYQTTNFGSISNSAVKGGTVAGLLTDTTYFIVQILGTLPQNFFSTITILGTTYNTASASFFLSGSSTSFGIITSWYWATSVQFNVGSTYPFAFT
jgi:hypothetical protein